MTRILIPVGGLIILTVLGGIAITVTRRRMFTKSAAAEQSGILDDLRRMRDRGEITPEEFDAARKSIAARLAGRDRAAAAPRSPQFPVARPRPGQNAS